MAKQQKTENGLRLGRWVLRQLAKGLLVVGLFAAGYAAWMQTTELLPIKQIAVTGHLQQVSASQLRDVVKPLVQEGFVRMDVLAIRDAVERLPWVSQVTVRRQWPDTLALDVEEQQLLARWGDEALVNDQGGLFYPQTIEVDEHTPQFEGVVSLSGQMADDYRRYQTLLSEAALSIRRLEVSERRAWRLELDNGIELVLGRDPSELHLQRFIDVYRRGLAQQAARINRVDLRYSNGFAIRWKENKVG